MAYVAVILAFFLGVFIGKELSGNGKKLLETVKEKAEDLRSKEIKILRKKEPEEYVTEQARAVELKKKVFSFFKK